MIFQQMMTEQVQDVLNNFEEAMEKITGLEKTFETKHDNRFNELLVRLPPPAAPVAPLQQQQLRPLPNQYGRAQRVPIEPGQNSGAAATADRGGVSRSFDEMITIDLVEVDFDDPTTNVRGRRALAIAKPTPRGY